MKYQLETVNCNYCGSDNYSIYIAHAKELYHGFDEYFDVVKCNECGFMYTNPRPTLETISYFYPDSSKYYQPKENKVADDSGRKKGLKRTLQRSVLANYFGYHLPRLPKILDFLPRLFLVRKLRLSHTPYFVEDGKLLDIGCAWGQYLWRMKELGWEVYGIELNAKAASFAKNELGLTHVRCGFVDDLDFPEQFFDVIHLSMVLEHLHNPTEVLDKVGRLLKKDGQLILSIPDISGFEARLFKNKSYTLHIPQHLSHFTPATISKFLQKSGFRVEHIIHHKSKKDLIKSSGYLENKLLHRLFKNPLIKGLIIRPLVAIMAMLGKTSRMSIFATKLERKI